jgi:Methylamine utilisation protein MauE
MEILLPALLAAATILVFAGVAKLWQPEPAIRFAATLAVPVPWLFVRLAAVVEIAVGLGALWRPRPAAIAIALLYALFTGLVARQLRRGGGLPCGCLGAREVVPSRLHLVLNGACACVGCLAAVAPPQAFATFAAAQPLAAALVGLVAVAVGLLSQAGLVYAPTIGAWQGGRA